VKLSINLRNCGPYSTRELLLDCARAVDESGLDTVWINERLALPPNATPETPTYSPTGRTLDPLATLAFLAVGTQRIGLVFRAWKSGLHLATVTTTMKYSTLCYLYGRMLLILLTSTLSSPLRATVCGSTSTAKRACSASSAISKPGPTSGSSVCFSRHFSSPPFSHACVQQPNG
jgi:hypothetical protein